jgi:hypothetical protein
MWFVDKHTVNPDFKQEWNAIVEQVGVRINDLCIVYFLTYENWVDVLKSISDIFARLLCPKFCVSEIYNSISYVRLLQIYRRQEACV